MKKPRNPWVFPKVMKFLNLYGVSKKHGFLGFLHETEVSNA